MKENPWEKAGLRTEVVRKKIRRTALSRKYV